MILKPNLLFTILLALLLAGCTGTRGTNVDRTSETIPGVIMSGVSDPSGSNIFRVSDGAGMTFEQLISGIAPSRVIFIGEAHDNPVHHLNQAKIIEAISREGRKPRVFFEMLDFNQADAVNDFQKKDWNPWEVNSALDWEKRGWYTFDIYLPIFEVIKREGLNFSPANINGAELRTYGSGSFPYPAKKKLYETTEIADETMNFLKKDILESHCGMLPESAAGKVTAFQLLRNAGMADAIQENIDKGQVVITGNYHAEKKTGAYLYLSPKMQTDSVSVLQIEVGAEDNKADAVKEMEGHADFVILTPLIEREDPCEKMREMVKPAPKPTNETKNI